MGLLLMRQTSPADPMTDQSTTCGPAVNTSGPSSSPATSGAGTSTKPLGGGLLGDIVCTTLLIGAHGSHFARVICVAGRDTESMRESDQSKMDFGNDARGAWKGIWGCGQGIGAVAEITSPAARVRRLRAQ